MVGGSFAYNLLFNSVIGRSDRFSSRHTWHVYVARPPGHLPQPVPLPPAPPYGSGSENADKAPDTT